ncbi:hypothetical protein SERLADRAFT_400022 [Serpula lacrymans var. lacrymans S7.9]|uniref:Uncharacterized protein n=1 Tax=Serpula lacrymans var. lacrymans (strain S7.9) TaxID=578457 RepID=F8P8Q4_SERL9|nr:uncharacterized protein SERLADRAFT_400022 [Serpula lacrymans var. lacrymans S7.9]EGO20810.1 hypothetical protein SERLADRAFT_400022 [Serpula lacrymans var. lacrymans S7.9]
MAPEAPKERISFAVVPAADLATVPPARVPLGFESCDTRRGYNTLVDTAWLARPEKRPA